jgi:hypothetical protein
MARKIKDYSVISYRGKSSPYPASKCVELIEEFKLRPNAENKLSLDLERAFRNYESGIEGKKLTPLPEDNRYIYKRISQKSKELESILSKLSFAHKLAIAGDSSLLTVQSISNMKKQLDYLSIEAEEALKDAKNNAEVGRDSNRNKNQIICDFTSHISSIYKEYSSHRNNVRGITKAKFCIHCLDTAKVVFRIDPNDKEKDIERVNKLLNPTRK